MLEGFANIGYKNSDLQSQFFTKVMDELEYPYRAVQKNDGGVAVNELNRKLNFEAPRKVVRDFVESPEFEDCLQALIEWKSCNKDTDDVADKDSLEAYVKRLIASVKETGEYQKDLAEAVSNVRTHYFKMREGLKKHQDTLHETSKELRFSLLELEDALVKAGLIDPRETHTEETESTRLQRAMRIFEDLCMILQPELVSPKHTAMIEAVAKRERSRSDRKWTNMEPSNEMGVEGIGRVLTGFVNVAYSPVKDIAGKDYLNKSFEKTLQPEGLEYIVVAPSLTKIWRDTRDKMLKIKAKYLDRDIARCSPLCTAFLFYPFARMGISTHNLFGQMEKNLAQENGWRRRTSSTDLAQVIFSMGHSTEQSPGLRETARKIADELYARCENGEVHYRKDLVLKSLWGLCNFRLYDHKLTALLVDELNLMPIDRLDEYLFLSEIEMLREIQLALRYEGRDKCPARLAKNINVCFPYESHLGRWKPYTTRRLRVLRNTTTDRRATPVGWP